MTTQTQQVPSQLCHAPLWACTSLARLRAAHACPGGFAQFLRHVKKTLPDVGDDDPIPLALACQSNSAEDVLWGLRQASCDPDHGDRERVLRELACDFAEHVLPIFEQRHPEDMRLRQAIQVARRFARGEATDAERRQARSVAAYVAATTYGASATDAAYAAYASATDAAAYAAYVAYDAANAAANADADAEGQWQLAHLAAVLGSLRLEGSTP